MISELLRLSSFHITVTSTPFKIQDSLCLVIYFLPAAHVEHVRFAKLDSMFDQFGVEDSFGLGKHRSRCYARHCRVPLTALGVDWHNTLLLGNWFDWRPLCSVRWSYQSPIGELLSIYWKRLLDSGYFTPPISYRLIYSSEDLTYGSSDDHGPASRDCSPPKLIITESNLLFESQSRPTPRVTNFDIAPQQEA